MKKSLPDRVPRSVMALLWAMAALHWRSGKKFAGITNKGIRALMGNLTDGGLRAMVKRAEETGLVVVKRDRRPRVIFLKHSTLNELEELWRT